MLSVKRVLIATASGFVFGLICMSLAASNPEAGMELTASIKMNIVLSRAMMGFMIGISAIKLQWWWHGIVLGLISSIPMAVSVFPQMDIFTGTFVMGIIYGFLTELITTKLFKAGSPVLT